MSDDTTLIDGDINAALAAIDKAAKQDKATESAAAKMQQARVDLVLGRDAKAVFFATIAMRLKLVPTRDVETAATDGKRIVYNPEFIETLDRKETVGLLAHEVMHVTNAHHARMGDRDHSTWNEACDLAINAPLKDAGMSLPKGALFPGEKRYAKLAPGLSAEEYYNALRKDAKQKPKDGDESSDDPGKCGGVMKPGSGSPAEVAQAEAEAREMAAAAQQAVDSSGRGDLPSGIGRQVAETLAPKADWRAILREFVSRVARNDYSWSRPNRRHVHRGLYLPGLRSEELGGVVLALDTSGSIGDELLATFVGEIKGILEAYDCTLTILYHHASVYRVQEWKTTDGPLVLEGVESGGTSHVPVFDHVEREVIDAACVVCLTDMETSFPSRHPELPTLWCDCSGREHVAPFGRVVKID
jgi:predicted metal-dependent peptidase